LRAVRIVFGLAFGVVLAVDRSPLPGNHPGCHPQPATEEVADGRMQIERAVRLAAMQVNGDADDRDVGHDQRVRDNGPSAGMQQTMSHEIKQIVEQGKILERDC